MATLLEHAQAAGMELEHSVPVTQAYVRALGRIVEAEVAHLQAVLGGVQPERRVEVLDRVLPAVITASTRGFEAVHRSLLHAALADELSPVDVSAGEQAVLVVALVDLSGSTRYLGQADAAETEALVDGLFRAGQAAAAAHPVRIVKYVGDGFFVSGRRPRGVVDAARTAIDLIDAELPLQARAGIAVGPVVRRAGDLFGLPVNVAQLLTKAAAPGTVVASEEVAAALPREMRGAVTTTPGPRGEQALRVVEVNRPG